MLQGLLRFGYSLSSTLQSRMVLFSTVLLENLSERGRAHSTGANCHQFPKGKYWV